MLEQIWLPQVRMETSEPRFDYGARNGYEEWQENASILGGTARPSELCLLVCRLELSLGGQLPL